MTDQNSTVDSIRAWYQHFSERCAKEGVDDLSDLPGPIGSAADVLYLLDVVDEQRDKIKFGADLAYCLGVIILVMWFVIMIMLLVR